MISFIIPFSTIEKDKFLNLNEKEQLWEENDSANIIFSTIKTMTNQYNSPVSITIPPYRQPSSHPHNTKYEGRETPSRPPSPSPPGGDPPRRRCGGTWWREDRDIPSRTRPPGRTP